MKFRFVLIVGILLSALIVATIQGESPKTRYWRDEFLRDNPEPLHNRHNATGR
jgi:hypothetical protein